MAMKPQVLEPGGRCVGVIAAGRPCALQISVEGLERGTLVLDVRSASPIAEGEGVFLCVSKAGVVPDVVARDFHWVSELSPVGALAACRCRINTHLWCYASAHAIVLLNIATAAPRLHPDCAVYIGVYFEQLRCAMEDGPVSTHLVHGDIAFDAELRFESEVSMLPTAELRLAHAAFYASFGDVDGMELSATGKASMGRDGDMELCYGEVQFAPFWEILRAVAPQPGEVFVDLGSGTGRAVLTAAMAFPELACCVGYEVVSSLHVAAEQLESRLRGKLDRMAPVRLLEDDFRELAWEEGVDILWVSSLCMEEETMQKVARRAVKLRPGARIVTMDQFFGEDMPELQPVSVNGLEQLSVEMSFGETNVYIQRRVCTELIGLETMD